MRAIKATSHELMVDYGPVTFELEAAHGVACDDLGNVIDSPTSKPYCVPVL